LFSEKQVFLDEIAHVKPGTQQGFKVWRGKIQLKRQDFCFCYMFKIFFLGPTKFGGTKTFGWHCPWMPLFGYGPASNQIRRQQKHLHSDFTSVNILPNPVIKKIQNFSTQRFHPSIYFYL